MNFSFAFVRRKKVQDVLSDINREEDLVKQQERTHATRVMGSSVNDRKLKLDNLRNNLANEQFHYLKEHSNDEVRNEWFEIGAFALPVALL